jgi:ribosomal-protein-alanine N-acetyltransferase
MKRDSSQLPWRIRFIVESASRRLIGSVKLKGPPTPAGNVEIGWGVVTDARGLGFAAEACKVVLDWSFGHEQVRRVVATIPSQNLASQRLAQRLGMRLSEETRRNLPVWEITRP